MHRNFLHLQRAVAMKRTYEAIMAPDEDDPTGYYEGDREELYDYLLDLYESQKREAA